MVITKGLEDTSTHALKSTGIIFQKSLLDSGTNFQICLCGFWKTFLVLPVNRANIGHWDFQRGPSQGKKPSSLPKKKKVTQHYLSACNREGHLLNSQVYNYIIIEFNTVQFLNIYSLNFHPHGLLGFLCFFPPPHHLLCNSEEQREGTLVKHTLSSYYNKLYLSYQLIYYN